MHLQNYFHISQGGNQLTHWPLGDLVAIPKMEFSILFYWLLSSHDDALRWMPQDLTDDKSTLVQVMAWCRQATSHYLSQCWLSSLSPHGVVRPQWVKKNLPQTSSCFFLYFFVFFSIKYHIRWVHFMARLIIHQTLIMYQNVLFIFW